MRIYSCVVEVAGESKLEENPAITSYSIADLPRKFYILIVHLTPNDQIDRT